MISHRVFSSRLYNEKAYVLSRGFVRHALQIPLGGLDDVIKDIYFNRGRLGKIIKSAKDLMEKSKEKEGANETSDSAVPRLTAGGVLTLTRTLDKLQDIQLDHERSPPPAVSGAT